MIGFILGAVAYFGAGFLVATVLALLDRFFNDDTKATLARLRQARQEGQTLAALEAAYRKETTIGFLSCLLAWPIVILFLLGVNLYKIWAYYVTDSRPI